MGTMTPARKPQMGIAASHHRRTLSSISANVGFQQANVEPDDSLPNYQYGRANPKSNRLSSTSPINYTNRMRSYENVPSRTNDHPPSNYMSTASTAHMSSEFNRSNHFERPDSLPFEVAANAKLRSSLRKYSNPSPRHGGSNVVSSMQAVPQKNSPTKTTPSDSLTSDDSSYLSAKEGSISSQSRVRFSPETLLEDAVANSTTTSVSTPLRRLSRSQRHSISDMLAPNTSS